jgi:hypothetical protein
MNNLNKFIEDVKKELPMNFSSYCPVCYGLPAIVNSHKCREGWEIWYNSNLKYEQRVKLCIEHINKMSYKRNEISLIYNSIGEIGSKGPDDSGLKFDKDKKDVMSDKKEFYLILFYIILITLGSAFIAYHSPIDCDKECQENYYD